MIKLLREFFKAVSSDELIQSEKMPNTRSVRPIPLPELLEDDTVGESLSADTDALQHTVTPQLIQNQVRVQLTSLRQKKQMLTMNSRQIKPKVCIQ